MFDYKKKQKQENFCTCDENIDMFGGYIKGNETDFIPQIKHAEIDMKENMFSTNTINIIRALLQDNILEESMQTKSPLICLNQQIPQI